MKKKKEKKKEFVLKEGYKLLEVGDPVLFIGRALVDRTEVVQVTTDTEFPFAMLKNGIRVNADYPKKEKELVITKFVPGERALVWGKTAKGLWENYQLRVKFNRLKENLSKVDFESLDKTKLAELIELWNNLIKKEDGKNNKE